jgi:SAM-dependent methyltransferase
VSVLPPSQYANDANLQARQRLWSTSERQPAFTIHPWVIGLARLNGHEAILEVGCGNGAYMELLSGFGLDSSTGMLAAARARTRNPLVAGDVCHLPFREATFDVVLAAHMLYHVDDRLTAIRELRRVLKRSGSCIAVTNGSNNQPELRQMIEDVVGGGWRWQRVSDVTFSLENGEEQLRVGFDDVQLVRCPDGVVLVTDADAVADYLRSMADHYEGTIEGSWEKVVEECRRRVAAVIESEGAFRISPFVGGFVCK